MIYDGDCNVCQALKRGIERRDRRDRLEFVPFQEADLEALAPGLDREMASHSVYLVRPDGRRFRGARAVFEALKRLPGAWGLAGRIWAFPPLSLLAEPFYRLVARNRDRISRWLGL